MRTLPDHLRSGMKLVIVGCNPGDRSARVGHYYAGRGNEFWPLLYDSGVVPELLDHRDDKRMIEFGIGLTDLVKRPTRGVDELRREEFAEGRILLAQKLEQYAPQVIAFNGKIAYESFSQRPCKLWPKRETARLPPACQIAKEIGERAHQGCGGRAEQLKCTLRPGRSFGRRS